MDNDKKCCEYCSKEVDISSSNTVSCDCCLGYFHYSENAKNNCSLLKPADKRILENENRILNFICDYCRRMMEDSKVLEESIELRCTSPHEFPILGDEDREE